MDKTKNIDSTFITDQPELESRLMKLGHAFTQAVTENNAELAEKIRHEALALKGQS